MLPELDLDIPELDIDLSAIEGFEMPDLSELLIQTDLDEFYFDLTGIDELLAEFISDEVLAQIDADLTEWQKGVDDLVLDFPEIELINLDGGGYEL